MHSYLIHIQWHVQEMVVDTVIGKTIGGQTTQSILGDSIAMSSRAMALGDGFPSKRTWSQSEGQLLDSSKTSKVFK